VANDYNHSRQKCDASNNQMPLTEPSKDNGDGQKGAIASSKILPPVHFTIR
jgi:hypothetical protein